MIRLLLGLYVLCAFAIIHGWNQGAYGIMLVGVAGAIVLTWGIYKIWFGGSSPKEGARQYRPRRERTAAPAGRRAAKKAKKADDDEEVQPLMLMLLQKKHKTLNAERVAQAIEKALNIQVAASPKDPRPKDRLDAIAVEKDGSVHVVGEVGFLNFSAAPEPLYNDREDFADKLRDLRAAKAVREHNAGVALCDMLPDKQNPETAAHRIARIAAELADGDTCGVVFMNGDVLQAVNAETWDMVRESDQPFNRLFGLNDVPVHNIGANDPEMLAAKEEARKRWPEFLEMFAAPQPGQRFVVKGPIGDGTHVEFMWVSVENVKDGVIYGELGSDPVNVTGIALGDPVEMPVEDLDDWMITQGDNFHGGFTVRVLQKAAGQGPMLR